MPGEGIVTIGENQWTVWLATTSSEVVQGLSGISQIPQGTGMLFDLGYDYNQIQINMQQMMFPLDIIFVNSVSGVVGVLTDVQPGDTDVVYEADDYPGARFFLEVNAGEAGSVQPGDAVRISASVEPQLWNTVIPILVATAVVLPVVAVLGKGLK